MSKESAEQILQMMKEQESEKMKQSPPARVGASDQDQKNKKDKGDTGEDW
jgi:hypothetical protein